MAYSNDFKLKLCKLICEEGIPASQVAREYNVSRQTLKVWLRTFRLDQGSFNREYIDKDWLESDAFYNDNQYLSMSEKELLHELMKKDIELARLKKGYVVKGVGAEKEYVSISKKNTK